MKYNPHHTMMLHASYVAKKENDDMGDIYRIVKDRTANARTWYLNIDDFEKHVHSMTTWFKRDTSIIWKFKDDYVYGYYPKDFQFMNERLRQKEKEKQGFWAFIKDYFAFTFVGGIL